MDNPLLTHFNSEKISAELKTREVLKIISEKTGVSIKDIISEGRRRIFVDARYIYFATLKRKFNMTLVDIGRLSGNRDHTTIIYGLKKFEDRFICEESYRTKVIDIFNELGYVYDGQKKSKILSSFKKIIKLLILSISVYSCNPKMHIIGYGMRKFNTSLNKYSKDKPYIKENSQIKK